MKSQSSLRWFLVCGLNILLIFQVLLLLQALHSLQWWLWAWFQRWAAWVFTIITTWYFLQIDIREIFILFWAWWVGLWVFIRLLVVLASLLLSLLALSVLLLWVHLWLLLWWTDFLELQWHHFFGRTGIPLFLHWRNVFHVFLLHLGWWFHWRLDRTLAGARIFHVHQCNIFPWLSDLAVLSLNKFEELVENLSSSFTILWIGNQLWQLFSLFH